MNSSNSNRLAEVIPLRGYKIIGITGQPNSGTIDLIVTLWNERTDENGFFTIGGSEVSSLILDCLTKWLNSETVSTSRILHSQIFWQIKIHAQSVYYMIKKTVDTFPGFVLAKNNHT